MNVSVMDRAVKTNPPFDADPLLTIGCEYTQGAGITSNIF